MTTKRFYYLLLFITFLFCFAIIGLTVAGNTLFLKQSDKLSQIKAEAQVIDEQKVSLAKAKNDIKNYTELNKIAKSIVPQDKDQAKTVREINNIAEKSGIKLQQISFETSSLGQATTSKVKLPSADLTQVQPVPGINGVFTLQITISSGTEAVSYYKFLQFLERLESNRRTAHVTNITVSPVSSGENVTFSLKLNAYLKP